MPAVSPVRLCLSILALAVALLAGPPLASARAPAAGRAGYRALVVGNADYRALPSLRGPREDAADMTAALKKLGYDVTTLVDADIAGLRAAVSRFEQSLKPTDRALVYLSGHGVQVQGSNWFLAVDASPAHIEDVPQTALRIDELVAGLGARDGGTTLIILDACSDPGLKSRSGQGAVGLGRLATTPPNTYVVYAAGYGQLAAGALKRNSLFTEKLLQNIAQPLPLNDIVASAEASVFEVSQGKQLPVVALSTMFQQGFTLGPPGSAQATRPPGPVATSGLGADPTKPGTIIQDCPFCPELVVVPAGTFEMGSSSGEARERPVHDASVPAPFAMGRFEITRRQWQACVAAGTCRPKALTVAEGYDTKEPVGNVSYDDAKDFVDWLSQQTQRRYRLPTETEWEYAARAGTSTAYPWGDALDPTRLSCSDCARTDVAPVDVFPPNAWGLYGMNGNLWEWTQDCYTNGYGQKPRAVCEESVIRGGAFDQAGRYATSSYRGRGLSTDEPGAAFGFRVARSLNGRR